MRVLVLALLEEVERPFGFQLQAREQISTGKTMDALIWILINAKNLQNKSFIAPFSSLSLCTWFEIGAQILLFW